MVVSPTRQFNDRWHQDAFGRLPVPGHVADVNGRSSEQTNTTGTRGRAGFNRDGGVGTRVFAWKSSAHASASGNTVEEL